MTEANNHRKFRVQVSEWDLDYATPRKVWLTIDPWTVGAGLMTTTLKLKRQPSSALRR